MDHQHLRAPAAPDPAIRLATASAGRWALPVLVLIAVLVGTRVADSSLGPAPEPEVHVVALEGTTGAASRAAAAKEAEDLSLLATLRTLRDGGLAKRWSAAMRRRSWTRHQLAPRFALARWRSLGIAHPALDPGTEEWLFQTQRTAPVRPWDEAHTARTAACIRAISRRMDVFGHRIAHLMLPSKATAVPERAPRQSAVWRERHERWVRRLRAEGLRCIDTLPILRELAPAQRWQPRDTHWAVAGQAAVAEAIAPALRAAMPRTQDRRETRLSDPVSYPRPADLARMGGMLVGNPELPFDYGEPEQVRLVLDEEGQILPHAPGAKDPSAPLPSVVVTGSSFMAKTPFGAFLTHALQAPVSDAAIPGQGPLRPLLASFPDMRFLGRKLPLLFVVDVLTQLLDDRTESPQLVRMALAENPPAATQTLARWTPKAEDPTGAAQSLSPFGLRLLLRPVPQGSGRSLALEAPRDLLCDGTGVIGLAFKLKAPMPGLAVPIFVLEPWPPCPVPPAETQFVLPILRRQPGSYFSAVLSPPLLAATESVELVLDVGRADPARLPTATEQPSEGRWVTQVTLPYLSDAKRQPKAPAVLLAQSVPPGPGDAQPVVHALRWVYDDGESVERSLAEGGAPWHRLLVAAAPERAPARPIVFVVEGAGPAPRTPLAKLYEAP